MVESNFLFYREDPRQKYHTGRIVRQDVSACYTVLGVGVRPSCAFEFLGSVVIVCFFILAGSFIVAAVGLTPSSEAHLILFGGEKSLEQEFRRPHQNHITSFYSKIDRRDYGNVLIARRIFDI